MTNLERVREALSDEDKFLILRLDALADIDAHLKEDAERDAKCRRVHAEANLEKEVEFSHRLLAELAELRETANFLSQRHELDEVALAELRVSNQAQYEAANKYQAELTELKERHIDEVLRHYDVIRELTELREAVREHIDGNGAPNRTHDRLRQLIEEEP